MMDHCSLTCWCLIPPISPRRHTNPDPTAEGERWDVRFYTNSITSSSSSSYTVLAWSMHILWHNLCIVFCAPLVQLVCIIMSKFRETAFTINSQAKAVIRGIISLHSVETSCPTFCFTGGKEKKKWTIAGSASGFKNSAEWQQEVYIFRFNCSHCWWSKNFSINCFLIHRASLFCLVFI